MLLQEDCLTVDSHLSHESISVAALSLSPSFTATEGFLLFVITDHTVD